MLDRIVNCIYGEDRFRPEGITKQIYLGDTDSIVIHSSLIDNLLQAEMIGTENGKLADDLNKQFLTTGYAKITRYCCSAPKKYACQYIMPNGTCKEKVKCNGINQRNMSFTNPFTEEQAESFTYDIFEKMYMDSLKDKFDVMGCVFQPNMNVIHMPDRLKRIAYNRTNGQISNNIPMFSIHSCSMDRELFTTQWHGRCMLQFPYTAPHGSVCIAIEHV